MKGFVLIVKKCSNWMNVFAELVLVIMMMLTVVDVALRTFGKPIVGTYELVAMFGAAVIGFSCPRTSWDRGHIFVDFLMENRSQSIKSGFFICTRIIGIIIYALLSWNLTLKGMILYKAGEVSLTLQAPMYPAAFGLSFCFFVQCLVLVADIVRINESKEPTEQITGEQL